MKDDATSGPAADGPYVFVCYSHDERDVVLAQIEWLRSRGLVVWYDEAIEAGSRWSDDLAHAVGHCAVFLYFLSPRSVGSRYCLDEVHYALECSRPIVPVELAPVELTPGLKLSLGATHRLFMHRMEPGEFRAKLERGLREAMASGAGSHAIESRNPPAQRLPGEPAAAVNWRPVIFGVASAMLAFVAMMVFGR